MSLATMARATQWLAGCVVSMVWLMGCLFARTCWWNDNVIVFQLHFSIIMLWRHCIRNVQMLSLHFFKFYFNFQHLRQGQPGFGLLGTCQKRRGVECVEGQIGESQTESQETPCSGQGKDEENRWYPLDQDLVRGLFCGRLVVWCSETSSTSDVSCIPHWESGGVHQSVVLHIHTGYGRHRSHGNGITSPSICSVASFASSQMLVHGERHTHTDTNRILAVYWESKSQSHWYFKRPSHPALSLHTIWPSRSVKYRFRSKTEKEGLAMPRTAYPLPDGITSFGEFWKLGHPEATTNTSRNLNHRSSATVFCF